ncbi:MAG: hypothetical protein O7D91_06440 [Planctomycetota bacterium]|nr:hypothetical protein [Planctomycetota bacterium]
MSRFIRAGLEGALADLIPKLVEIVEDPKTQPWRCLRLMEFLRDISRASLSLHQPMPFVDALRDAAEGHPQIPEIRIRRPDAQLRRSIEVSDKS